MGSRIPFRPVILSIRSKRVGVRAQYPTRTTRVSCKKPLDLFDGDGGSEGPKEGSEAGQLGRESNLGGAARARGAQGKGPLPPSPCPLSAVGHRWPSGQDTQMTEPAWVYTRTHTRACLERRASPHHSPSSSPRSSEPQRVQGCSRPWV